MKLENLIVVSLMSVFLMSCSATTQGAADKRILISPKATIWTLLTDEQKEKPLKEYEGYDIFTPETAREIKDHNDSVRK